jgi:hypothetical protein
MIFPSANAEIAAAIVLPLAQQTLLDKLDDATRTKVLAALAGLILLGFLMVALVWLGARFTRRYMASPSRHDSPRTTQHNPDDWAKNRREDDDSTEHTVE